MVGQSEGKSQKSKGREVDGRRNTADRLNRLLPAVYRMRLCLRFALCLLTFALPFDVSSSLSQQSPSIPVSRSPQQAFILRSQTNEVLVDVRVYDKSGKPVTDLKQSDFRVTEDGAPQNISDFSLEDVEKLSQATADNEKAK